MRPKTNQESGPTQLTKASARHIPFEPLISESRRRPISRCAAISSVNWIRPQHDHRCLLPAAEVVPGLLLLVLVHPDLRSSLPVTVSARFRHYVAEPRRYAPVACPPPWLAAAPSGLSTSGWGFHARHRHRRCVASADPDDRPGALAAWCFARSSERFDQWMLNHRVFGPIVRDWRSGAGVHCAGQGHRRDCPGRHLRRVDLAFRDNLGVVIGLAVLGAGPGGVHRQQADKAERRRGIERTCSRRRLLPTLLLSRRSTRNPA